MFTNKSFRARGASQTEKLRNTHNTWSR